IRSAMEMLAREETLNKLTEQYGRSEAGRRECSDAGTARELALLASRLEQINAAVCHLSESMPMQSLEERLRTLALSVEHFARAQTSVAPGYMQMIERRLDEISRAIAAIAKLNHPANSSDLERIEARILALSRRFEALGEQEAGPGLL